MQRTGFLQYVGRLDWFPSDYCHSDQHFAKRNSRWKDMFLRAIDNPNISTEVNERYVPVDWRTYVPESSRNE